MVESPHSTARQLTPSEDKDEQSKARLIILIRRETETQTNEAYRQEGPHEIRVKTQFRPTSLLQPHYSEIRGICSTNCSRGMLQNWPYFIYMKTHSCFFHFSFHATLFFP